MARGIAFLYGVLTYALFLLVFLYAIGFVGNVAVPKSIDVGGPSEPLGKAVLINVLLLGLFAFQHSVMARQWFKRRWTRLVPQPVERSTYVLLASAVLALVMWQWRPIPEPVWDASGTFLAPVLQTVFWIGWGIVLLSTFLIDHFELFGVKQVTSHLRGREHRHPEFQAPFLYRVVRHPLYLGFVLAFWSAPVMSRGHLLFAAVTTAWILVAIQFEERDLVSFHGTAYVSYRERVRMLIPIPRRGGGIEENPR